MTVVRAGGVIGHVQILCMALFHKAFSNAGRWQSRFQNGMFGGFSGPIPSPLSLKTCLVSLVAKFILGVELKWSRVFAPKIGLEPSFLTRIRENAILYLLIFVQVRKVPTIVGD